MLPSAFIPHTVHHHGIGNWFIAAELNVSNMSKVSPQHACPLSHFVGFTRLSIFEISSADAFLIGPTWPYKRTLEVIQTDP